MVSGYKNPGALAKRLEKDLWKVLDEMYPADEVPDAFKLFVPARPTGHITSQCSKSCRMKVQGRVMSVLPPRLRMANGTVTVTFCSLM